MTLTRILTMLAWGVAATALLNLLAIVALIVSYAWNDWLLPRLEHRRARQRAFEQLLAQSNLKRESMVSEPTYAGEC
jgi:hypothetical protein